MPYLGMYFEITVCVLPKIEVQESKWSPFFSNAIKDPNTALIPLAVANPSSAFSNTHKRSINSCTFGLEKRL